MPAPKACLSNLGAAKILFPGGQPQICAETYDEAGKNSLQITLEYSG
jgi:hypothetical protein